MQKQLRIHKIPIEKIQVDPRKILDMQRKIEANLASDSELKASAQRAFVAYVKSTFLLKNKDVFKVAELNTDRFANSLGLIVPPRLRFLQKQGKKSASTSAVDSSEKKGQKFSSHDSSDEDSEDEILTVKRKNHEIETSIGKQEFNKSSHLLFSKTLIYTCNTQIYTCKTQICTLGNIYYFFRS